MKLILLILFSASLTAFSQDGGSGTVYIGRHYNELDSSEKAQFRSWHRPEPKPDTLRATLLVSFSGGKVKRIPFTMPGFVVRVLKTAVGSVRDYELLYLDDNKKQIKAPLKVFSYVKD